MIILNNISLSELKKMMPNFFGDLVKAVVDIDRQLVALDAQLHVDLEELLLEEGSKQKDLWGINLYPDLFGTDNFIEFDSMINIRPSHNNNSRNVEDEETRKQIITIISKSVQQ
ncbi:MAG: hypothetical protein A2887_04940 [Alphaproteobacteria bacterium RIFCSPLOWO2_01_FULL_40_26]|nr:MAG: hypothetical protein A3D15_06840 [Alphaproteobacteria bacterium RIFCSPHIGHO2_02_FULL_40_34]OFW88226.1 MAG: hypothetical protein A2794_03420 [Alphaproteobacteria bacterium RIFCSPHIGHO2_01_FULL_40_8]OFW94398.1 MAG: hypothetical protein A2887_04940 [Alphaproteobacteria bacterium RIFCSPLOWO2_01_FULL_40_26]OFX09454.1 MAG: hypothetical protein A3H30_02015 [Alphaproteobacteria bacterium RIFCSPLOWO2_02_FULL_40_19]OFX11632.1 MAG: hypothetical protein A3G22_06645 [Alphaproteobacteria bacterium RI